ncbi:MAG: C1 family peptidase [Chitinophagales bacterium]
MKRILLLLSLSIFVLAEQGFAQRKGLVFSKESYENVPKADDQTLGYTDESLPSAVSHKKYAPYPGNQGDYGTCVGWSSSYGALSIEYAKQMNITDRQQITFTAFCPYYIYNQFKSEFDFFCQSGGLFEDALEILYTKGAKRYYLPEYSCYSDYEDFSLENAGTFKIKNYYRLFDWDQSEFSKALGLESTRIENIKKAVAQGHPVLWGAYVPPSFDYLTSGKELWTPTQEEKDSYNKQPGHAMVIVGYDDNKYGGAFEVMNSWGTDWGNKGFFWVKYDDADLFGHTAFYMDLGYKYYPSSGCQLGDCANGYGRYKWATGEVYEGELKDNFFDGEGIYTTSTGSYAGGWKDGLKHGKGVQLYTSGSITTGYWKDNNYVGTTEPEWETNTNVVINPVNNDEEEEEEYYDDDYDFFEEIINPSTGCVSGDCENGYGKFIYSDGDIYEGNFKSSYRHGHGKYQYIEGDIYDGMWSWSNREGLGYYKWPSGNEYIGYWSNNQQNGKGTKFFVGGTIQAGQWSNGAFQSDESTFGYSNSDNESGATNSNKAGTIFNRVDHGEEITPSHKQVPMKQGGFNAIPKSGLGAPMEDPYHNFTKDVLDNILRSLGKTDLSNPKVNIIESNRDVAYTNKNTGIHVSTKFIDLCRSFGADSASALSVVLAHELGHYFKDHFFCRDFGYAYGNTEWGDQISETFKQVHETGYYETQADEFGLFFSFISGYDPFKVAEEVIEKVYSNFSLPDEMTGYPPKDFRIKQIGIAEENVKKLIPVFEAGNYMSILSAINQKGINNDLSDNAILCYEHIIGQKITTAEMYNNLGVNYVNRAINAISTAEFPFALPMEIDFNSRLYSTTGSGTKGDDQSGWEKNQKIINEWLTQAKAYFEEAIKIDENYVQGYNNLSAAYILLKDYDEAWVKAKKGRKISKDMNTTIEYRNSLDLLALISWLNEETEDAESYWEDALKLNSTIAKHNIEAANFESLYQLAKINKNEQPATAQTNGDSGLGSWQPAPGSVSYKYKRPDFREIEKVKNKTLNDIAQDYIYNNKAIDTWNLKDNKAIIGTTQYDEGELLIFGTLDRGNLDKSYYFYTYPANGKEKTSLSITNGQDVSAVETTYGEPVSIVSSANHNFWVYVNKNIIFKINQQNKVDGYIIYDVNL